MAALALSATTLAAPGAEAEPDDILADGLLAPLSLAVSGDDVYYASGGFAPGNPYTISQVGVEEPIVTSDKELGALAVDGSTMVYIQGRRVMQRSLEGGEPTILANLGTYEKQNNPDGDTTYGFMKTAPKCLKQLPKNFPGKYKGIVESHPYGSAIDGDTVYVADAAANAIYSISDGTVEVVTVLKPVPVTVTKAFAKETFGKDYPKCVVGKTYKFEGVPTDVELGPDGRLYVSKLPGGEIPGKGAVVSVNTETGGQRMEMNGLSGATGVAVAENGDIYASNLFGPGISLNEAGNPFDASVPLAAAVEIDGAHLYATINVLPMGPQTPPDGQVARWNLQVP